MLDYRRQEQDQRRTSYLGRRIESLGFIHETVEDGDRFSLEADEDGTIVFVVDAKSGAISDLPSDPEHLLVAIYRHPAREILCEEFSIEDLEAVVRVFREPIPEALASDVASPSAFPSVFRLFKR